MLLYYKKNKNCYYLILFLASCVRINYKWQVELIRIRDENNDKSETEPRQLF